MTSTLVVSLRLVTWYIRPKRLKRVPERGKSLVWHLGSCAEIQNGSSSVDNTLANLHLRHLLRSSAMGIREQPPLVMSSGVSHCAEGLCRIETAHIGLQLVGNASSPLLSKAEIIFLCRSPGGETSGVMMSLNMRYYPRDIICYCSF